MRISYMCFGLCLGLSIGSFIMGKDTTGLIQLAGALMCVRGMI